jgi:hypothetical protein
MALLACQLMLVEVVDQPMLNAGTRIGLRSSIALKSCGLIASAPR